MTDLRIFSVPKILSYISIRQKRVVKDLEAKKTLFNNCGRPNLRLHR